MVVLSVHVLFGKPASTFPGHALLLAQADGGGVAGQLEALAGVCDSRAVDLEDRYVLVDKVAHQQIFSVWRKPETFRQTTA